MAQTTTCLTYTNNLVSSVRCSLYIKFWVWILSKMLIIAILTKCIYSIVRSGKVWNWFSTLNTVAQIITNPRVASWNLTIKLIFTRALPKLSELLHKRYIDWSYLQLVLYPVATWIYPSYALCRYNGQCIATFFYPFNLRYRLFGRDPARNRRRSWYQVVLGVNR